MVPSAGPLFGLFCEISMVGNQHFEMLFGVAKALAFNGVRTTLAQK